MSLFLTNSGASLVLATGGIPVLGSSPITRGEHPRLLFVADDSVAAGTAPTVSTLRARVTSGGPYATHFAQWISYLQTNWALIGSGTDIDLNCAKSLAYVGQIGGGSDGSVTLASGSWTKTNAEYRAKALDALAALYAYSIYPQYWDAHGIATALVYDWCYPWMTTEQRTTYAAYVLRYAENPWSFGGWGDFGWADVPSASPYQEQVCVGRALIALAGIATLNDPEANQTHAQTCYDRYADGFTDALNGVWPWEQARNQGDGGWGQGFGYGVNYNSPSLIVLQESYRTAHGLSRAATWGTGMDAFKKGPHWLLARYPNHGIPTGGYPDNKSFILTGPGTWATLRSASCTSSLREVCSAIAGLYEDLDAESSALAAWFVNHRARQWTADGYSLSGAPQAFWIYGPANGYSEQTPSALGLAVSQRFAEGTLALRSGWGDDDTFVFANHMSHLASYGRKGGGLSGSFEVDRRGPLLAHNGWDVHLAVVVRCAGNHPIFANTTFAESPGETESLHACGGQRNLDDIPQAALADIYDEGHGWEVGTSLQSRLADGATRLMDYWAGNYTKAYNGPTYYTSYSGDYLERGCQNWHRTMIFARRTSSTASDRLVVMDSITRASSDYEVRIQLRPSGTTSLTVDGSATANSPDRPSSLGTGRRTLYAGASNIEWANTDHTGGGFQGRAFLTILNPSCKVVKEGGASISGNDPYWLDAYGYQIEGNTASGLSLPPVAKAYGGDSGYKLEMIATAPQTTDRFLYTLEIADSTVQGVGAKATTALLSTTGDIYAVRLGTDIFVLSTDPETPYTSGTITCPDIGTATWRVFFGHLSTANRSISPSHGSLAVVDGTLVSGTTYTPTAVTGASGGVLEFTLAVTAGSTITVS